MALGCALFVCVWCLSAVVSAAIKDKVLRVPSAKPKSKPKTQAAPRRKSTPKPQTRIRRRVTPRVAPRVRFVPKTIYRPAPTPVPKPVVTPKPTPLPKPTPVPEPVEPPQPPPPRQRPELRPSPLPRTSPPFTPSWIPRSRHRHTKDVRAVAYSHDGGWLASASWRVSEKSGVPVGEVKLWDVATGAGVRDFTGHWAAVNAIAFSPDDEMLATASQDKSIFVWRTSDGSQLGKLSGEAHTNPVMVLDISPDGKTLVSGDGKGVLKFWNLAERTLERTLNLEVQESLRSIAFSWTKNLVATGGETQKVRLWDMQTGENKGTLTEDRGYVAALAFSPDGKYLASANFKTVWLWDLSRESAPRAQSENSGVVKALAFSSDSQLLASGGEGDSLVLWHLGSDERRSLSGQRSEVAALCFDPSNNELASSDIDGNVLIWK